jgi:copper chaperone
MRTEHLKVDSMSCGGCVTRMTDALKALFGVGGVDVALSAGKVDVTYDEPLAQPPEFVAL